MQIVMFCMKPTIPVYFKNLCMIEDFDVYIAHLDPPTEEELFGTDNDYTEVADENE